MPGRLQSAAEADLRIRRQYHPQHGRHRRDALLPVRVHAVHVHPDSEHHRAHSLCLHRDDPHHHHRDAGAVGVPDGPGLRLLEERAALLQPVRAQGHPDLHPAADRVHRGAVVPLAADLAQRASVRQHAGRAYHAEGVRQLHHVARRRRHFRHGRRDAAAWHWWSRSPRWNCWSPFCKLTSSPSSPASISTMQSIRATEARND